MKVDILAIGVHPDDIELSCSGTLLSQIHHGRTVGLLDLTRGELGSRGTPEIRDNEARNAAEMMGAKFRLNLGMADGFFQYTKENLIKIVRVLRDAQPEIVLANAIDDRHPDHGRAAKLVADACYYSGLKKIETQSAKGNDQIHWRPKAVYHYIQDYNLEPDFVVDISEFIDKKLDLVMAFGSQFYNPNAKEFEMEPKTPISSKEFFDFLRAKAATYGRHCGFQYAEGFTAPRTIGVEDLFVLK